MFNSELKKKKKIKFYISILPKKKKLDMSNAQYDYPHVFLSSGYLQVNSILKGYKCQNQNQAHDSFIEYLLRALWCQVLF